MKLHTRVAIGISGGLLALAAGLACGGAGTPDGPALATASIDPTTTATATPTAKPVSVEQQNANKAAEDYLDGQAFSRKELIDQLKFDKYPAKVATIAVDSLHADWNKQAALSAKDYLDGQAFSRKELVSQLEFDGFTHDQAVYGVTQAGL